MEKYFGNFKNLIIVVLIIVIIILRQCSGNGGTIENTPTGPATITKIETKYDTIPKDVVRYVPKIVTIIKTDTFPLTQIIDTAVILEDYFAKYVYDDFQKLDSLNITIRDTVSQNKIISRKISYDLIYPRTTVTETKYINQNEFYFGFGLNGTTKQFNYVGGSILYRTKKKKVFGVGIGLNDQFQPMISTQFLWKIGKK